MVPESTGSQLCRCSTVSTSSSFPPFPLLLLHFSFTPICPIFNLLFPPFLGHFSSLFLFISCVLSPPILPLLFFCFHLFVIFASATPGLLLLFLHVFIFLRYRWNSSKTAA